MRTHQVTAGEQTPWHSSAVAKGTLLAPSDGAERPAAQAARPMNLLSADEAYARAIEEDALAGYAEFARSFPRSVFTPRFLAMLRVRREALTWQRALANDSPEAYWSYVKAYPAGIYVPDAQRRLARLSAPLLPPPVFEQVRFGIPPPVPNEPAEVKSLPSAPPPPASLMAPRPALYASLSPPRETTQRGPRVGRSVLPAVSLPRAAPQAAPAETKTPATAKPRPAAPRAPHVAAPQSGAAQRPQLQPPRSLAPPAQRPAPQRPAPAQPQCVMENGMPICR
jgi:hypothetical protein